MIQRDKILQQLQSKRDQFVAFEDSFQDEAGRYLDALDRMSMLPGSELTRRLASASRSRRRRSPGSRTGAPSTGATSKTPASRLSIWLSKIKMMSKPYNSGY
jgi:hypothetical protein